MNQNKKSNLQGWQYQNVLDHVVNSRNRIMWNIPLQKPFTRMKPNLQVSFLAGWRDRPEHPASLCDGSEEKNAH